MAIIGRLPDIHKHFKGNSYFQRAFSYFERVLDVSSQEHFRIQNLPLNAFEKVVLGEDLFALEQKFYSKPRTDCFLESHIKYIDIQMIVSGEELMECCDISKCQVKDKYCIDKDLIIYEDYTDMNKILLKRGDFGIFFPQDVHLGCQMHKAPTLCTKTVIKIPLKYFSK